MYLISLLLFFQIMESQKWSNVLVVSALDVQIQGHIFKPI